MPRFSVPVRGGGLACQSVFPPATPSPFLWVVSSEAVPSDQVKGSRDPVPVSSKGCSLLGVALVFSCAYAPASRCLRRFRLSGLGFRGTQADCCGGDFHIPASSIASRTRRSWHYVSGLALFLPDRFPRHGAVRSYHSCDSATGSPARGRS